MQAYLQTLHCYPYQVNLPHLTNNMSRFFDKETATPSISPIQSSFEDIIWEINAQNAHIQLLKQQRETMMQVLLWANA